MHEPGNVDDLFRNNEPHTPVNWRFSEVPTSDEPKRPENSSITAGRNLERIQEEGWETFRANLEKCSYAQILNDYIPGPELFSFELLRAEQLNTQQLQLLKEKLDYALNLLPALEKAVDKTIASVVKDREKKIAIIGKNQDRSSSQMVRVYVGCETQNSPLLFAELVGQLRVASALDKITIALNLENFDDSRSLCQTNSIIIYCQGGKAPMKEVAQAIQNSKRDHPKLWPQEYDTVRLFKEKFARDLMIPIDDTVAFVEMKGGDSYHSTVAGSAKQELFGTPRNISLDTLRTKMAQWSINRPGEFSSDNPAFKGRKKYLPALVNE